MAAAMRSDRLDRRFWWLWAFRGFGRGDFHRGFHRGFGRHGNGLWVPFGFGDAYGYCWPPGYYRPWGYACSCYLGRNRPGGPDLHSTRDRLPFAGFTARRDGPVDLRVPAIALMR